MARYALMFDENHDPIPADAPKVRVIPFGYEESVSYGYGAADGPAAIIAAAPQVELFDEELWCEPILSFNTEVAKQPEIAKGPEAALQQLDDLVETALSDGAFPLVFGGEHTITAGAIRPLVRRHPDLVLLHFDAHADLRDIYEDNRHSHACAIRRCLEPVEGGHEDVSVVSLGIRNISRTEIPFLEANRDRVHIHWAKDKAQWNIEDIIAPLRGKKVWVTIDVDGFDGSVMPATGTPEPGGMFWDDVTRVLRAAAEVSDWVGADINELAPKPELHACDFLCAKLAYKLLGYNFAMRG
ncbi:agmatinase [Parvularcula oceani]|uniref:agmatinase n=1 Tax=Parvularcula oceani TaxID=1247963 RepID=UPI000691CF52|nr:agmatinase [Parvularcula oceani]